MSTKREINTLIDLARKVGQAFCDKNTFKETSSDQIIQEWKYQGAKFRMNFQTTQSDEIVIEMLHANEKKVEGVKLGGALRI